MSDSRKKRMSMLDNLTQTGAAHPAPSMMTTNRALRSARDAVDSHRIWELDPEQITDDRTADRLDPKDIDDLRSSIEAVGQTVPILVRRDPRNPEVVSQSFPFPDGPGYVSVVRELARGD